MEGSESEAIFESLNLKPQLFINEVLNCVDDLIDEAFTFFHEQASTIVKSDGTYRSDDFSRGVGRIRNLIHATLDKRLDMWEKYCLRHCFVVPEGFSLPKADSLTDEGLLDVDTLGDSELDAQLNCLRDKLTLVGQETAVLKGDIAILERQSDLVNHSASSIDEVLQLCEKNSLNETFQELTNTASEFRAKVEKLKARRMEETSRSVSKRMSNGDMFKASSGVGKDQDNFVGITRNLVIEIESIIEKLRPCYPTGFFDGKLEDLLQFLDDMKTA